MMEKVFKPDTVMYGSLMDALAQENKIDVALGIWNQVLDNGFQAGVIMHNILINALCFVGKVEEALHVCMEMKQKRCTQNLARCNMLMDGLIGTRYHFL